MPPGQRRRRFSMARDAGIVLPGHPDRPHRDTDGDEVRVQHRLFRRARLLLLPQIGVAYEPIGYSMRAYTMSREQIRYAA